MASPRAVVIPFGVPDDGRGLGLGLAALVHSFAQIDGESVALAQLLARKQSPSADDSSEMSAATTDEEDDDDDASSSRISARAASASDREGEPSPVEAFVPPHAWRDLTGSSAAPPGVSFVVTGAFEPPTDGRGLIQLLVFDTKDGRTRAKVEALVDGESAGKTLIAAFDEIFTQLGGELGNVRDIDDLPWEALESVLRAERCALHDPLRGGPHDRLAAMVHLGRAIGDAPEGRFPATRLAALALDVAVGGEADPKLAEAALRALVRATEDAPGNADLIEALAALSLRLGNGDAAEGHARAALAIEPSRPRIYALLSEARRSRGDLPGALQAIEDGLLHGADDPLLNTERGIVLAERGNLEQAERAWRMVLELRPLYPPAYTNLASLVMDRKDSIAAAHLVDDALRHGGTPNNAHPDVLRRAIQLSLAAEPEGIARGSRVSTLARALVDRVPNDAWARLVLARALAITGERSEAVRRLTEVERLAEQTSFAAEAQRGRLALEDPQVSLEIDSVLRAAYQAAVEDLETIATRAKTLATTHQAWHAWFALGIAERRRERWRAARDAFSTAISVAPGCTPAHMEIVAAHVALGDPEPALHHAKRACELEGESARTLAVLATALLAAGKREEATSAIDRALTLDATDEANRALAERIRAGRARTSTLTRLRDIFTRFRRK